MPDERLTAAAKLALQRQAERDEQNRLVKVLTGRAAPCVGCGNQVIRAPGYGGYVFTFEPQPTMKGDFIARSFSGGDPWVGYRGRDKALMGFAPHHCPNSKEQDTVDDGFAGQTDTNGDSGADRSPPGTVDR